LANITLADVERLRGISPRRCHFAKFPVVKKEDDGSYTASFRFVSLARLFELETGIQTRDGQFGPYCYLYDQATIDQALKWQDARKDLVFLRDNMSFSVAAGMNLESAGVYTDLGRAEHDAKVDRDEPSIGLLAAACEAVIKTLQPYKNADAICAVPPSPGKEWDLPTKLADRVAYACGKDDISSALGFAKMKESVKQLTLEQKWAALEAAGLQGERQMVAGKRVVLLDDKYRCLSLDDKCGDS
jgi:hypothetical protein